MAKINQNEFNKWGEMIQGTAELFIRDTRGEEYEKKKKLVSLICNNIKSRNTFVLLFSIGELDKINLSLPQSLQEEKGPAPCENGEIKKITLQEWIRYVFQRIEEHHKTRVGKEIKDQDLISIIQKWEKIKDWNKDKEKREKLLTKIYQTDPEGYDLIWGIINFLKELQKIDPQENFFDLNSSPSEEEIGMLRYFFEDFSQIIFKAAKELEQDSNQGNQEKEMEKEKKHQVELLKEQIEKLKEQNAWLKEKLAENTQLTEPKRKLLEERLSNNNYLLKKSENELKNLQNNLKENGDNDKTKPVVVIGIFAAALALIGLIIAIIRRSRHHDY